MAARYLPFLILGGVTLILAALFVMLSRLLGPYRPNKAKSGVYESGMDPIGEADERYSIQFYQVAMAFIVFDLEVLFIYPWAVQYLGLGIGTLVDMIIFILELLVGLIYIIKKGTLDWEIDQYKH
jgi:NADH-quinone oxidoreductase subunit A